nr:hypothetical protein Iba_chr12dCG7990 [Ipomoea batatas]
MNSKGNKGGELHILWRGRAAQARGCYQTSSEELEPIEIINVVQQTSSCRSAPTTRAPDQDYRKWILGIDVGSSPSLLQGTQDLLIDSPEASHSSDSEIGRLKQSFRISDIVNQLKENLFGEHASEKSLPKPSCDLAINSQSILNRFLSISPFSLKGVGRSKRWADRTLKGGRKNNSNTNMRPIAADYYTLRSENQNLFCDACMPGMLTGWRR